MGFGYAGLLGNAGSIVCVCVWILDCTIGRLLKNETSIGYRGFKSAGFLKVRVLQEVCPCN